MELVEPSAESRITDDLSRSVNESSMSILKQSLKMSLGMPLSFEPGSSMLTRNPTDGAVRLYKSSTLALGRSNPALNASASAEADADELESRRSVSQRASWEDDVLVREGKSRRCRISEGRALTGPEFGCLFAANSSLPVVRHAIRNEHVAAANQLDRMTIWIKNVESAFFLR